MDFFTEMEEALNAVPEYFNQLNDRVNTMLSEAEATIDKMEAYIQFSSYYYFISGALLVIMFIMLCVVLSKLSKLSKSNTALQDTVIHLNKKLDGLESSGTQNGTAINTAVNNEDMPIISKLDL